VAAEVETSEPGDGVWSPGKRALTTGLVLTITLVGFEALAIATVMPVVSKDLNDVGLYGWVFSAFFLGTLIGIVFAGRASDRVGPAQPFTVGLVLFAAGLIAGGAAPSMLLLVVARAVQGLGAGAIPAVAYVAIGRAYKPALQPRMFAVISSAWVLPAVLGPTPSGAVADAFGWRWVFFGLLPFVVVAGVMTIPALHALGAPGGGEPADRRIDAVLVALGAGLVLGGASADNALVGVPLAIAGFAIGGPAFKRLVPPGTLRLAPGMPAAIALRGIITFAFFGTDAFVSLTMTSVHGVSATVAGIPLTTSALAWTAGAWIQERRVRVNGPRALVRTGTAIIAVGIAMMIVTAAFDVPIAFGILAWSVGGLGMGLSFAPLSLIMLQEAEPGAEGAASAALTLSGTLGVALGTGAVGAIVAAGETLGWTSATALTIGFIGCCAVALFASGAAVRLPNAIVHHD